MASNKPKIQVFKIGGKIVNDDALLNTFLNRISEVDGAKIVIHGGGNKASEVLKQMGIEPNMVEGRRITDAKTLEIVTMVYGGLINKNIVAKLQSRDVNALGMSGADGNVIQSHKRPVKEIDYGWVGDIEKVDNTALLALCDAGFVPVLCALTHDKKGNMLNTNADTIASRVAGSLAGNCEVSLKFCFELKGVLRDFGVKDSVIPSLRSTEVDTMHASGVINDGMIPKLKNGFDALRSGVNEVSICHIDEMNINNAGTNLVL